MTISLPDAGDEFGISNEKVLEYIRSGRDDDTPALSVKEAEFDILVSGICGRDEPGSHYFAEPLEARRMGAAGAVLHGEHRTRRSRASAA